jgi:DNA-nicking Smr family endonuclease
MSRPSVVRPNSRLNALADLKQVKAALAEQARLAEEAQKLAAEKKRQQDQEQNLFRKAVGAVQTLPDKGMREPDAKTVQPVARQKQLDEQAALRESLSDEFDVTTLLDVDDQMSFRRPGIGTDVTAKLRRGHWSMQAEIDLHGLRTDEAREALGEFLRNAKTRGIRCVRVVHGKGLGSPGKTPVLKTKVQRWLVQKQEVLAFVQAKAADGGAGALLVLLAPGG